MERNRAAPQNVHPATDEAPTPTTVPPRCSQVGSSVAAVWVMLVPTLPGNHTGRNRHIPAHLQAPEPAMAKAAVSNHTTSWPLPSFSTH